MTAAQYVKKPVVIEAVRWTGQNWDEVCGFLGVPENGRGDQENTSLHSPEGPDHMPVIIHTLEGDMRADLGDWIIKGIRGEFYPCKPDIFSATYERVAGYNNDGTPYTMTEFAESYPGPL